MVSSYFLGANTGKGFRSLYAGFPADKAAFLHVIKGGPGTGKSSFMRAIGRRAEALGIEAEYVLCSGDPDSLDGVYIPALNAAWVDGTAPHIADPAYFAVNGDYVNLGQFCRTPLSAQDGKRITDLTKTYREEYRRAYAYLAAASSLSAAPRPQAFGEVETAHIRKRTDGILPRCSQKLCKSDYVNYIYLRAFSCKGMVQLTEPLNKLCKQIYRFDSEHGADEAALGYAAEEARRRGLRTVICLSPLNAESIDAVLLPDHSTALVSSVWELEAARTVHLDRYLPAEARRELRPSLRRTRQLYNASVELALERLGAAKALHDELEAVYHGYMDFPALTDFTERQLEKIFM